MFAKKIGIDLGTVNTLVYIPDKGIVLREPSVVALDVNSKGVTAVGKEAEEMLGRTPESLRLYKPLRDGVIADFHATQAMLKHFINQSIGRLRLVKPDVMVAVPTGATSTERKAVIDATVAAGARTAYIIPEPVAAALGAEVDITEAAGNMIVDIGGGTTEIAVISLGGVVAQTSVRAGGVRMDNAIIEYLRRQYGLTVGDRTAEEVKQKIATATALKKELKMDVKGRDVVGGLPKSITLTSNELIESVQEVLDRVVLAIRQVMEKTPPELVSDIMDRGILLSGGVAQLPNLDQLLAKIIGVPIVVVNKPLDAVAVGTGMALGNLSEYQKSLVAVK